MSNMTYQPQPSAPTAAPSTTASSAAQPAPCRPILTAINLTMDYAAKHPNANAFAPSAATVMPTPRLLALNSVDFQLNAKETVAVMGPSGSGKSTLLHVLAGIDKPTSGRVLYQAPNVASAQDLTSIPDAERTMLRRSAFGFVFQSGQLLPELPAVENIALPMMLGGISYAQATDCALLWMERLGLKALAAQRPGEMSGGQMQRIAIARALAARPNIVFADEPTGALDQATGREVMAILMAAAHENGAAVIVVTHDPNVASFCSRTVTMQDGVLQ